MKLQGDGVRWEEELECEVCVDRMRLEHVSGFKYFGCVFEESGTDEAQCSRNVASMRRVASAIRSLVNARSLQLECASVLHESLIVSILMYGREIWREKERSSIMVAEMDNLRGLLGIRRMDKVPNVRMREL